MASRSKCMETGCDAPPENECVWAGGRAHAWFCGKHYEPWKKEADKGSDGEGGWLELVKERKVMSGVVGEKYGEEPKKASVERVVLRKQAEMSTAASVALMKWLSRTAKRLGVAQHVYVVGGAVRNFLIEEPIKDIDMVVDSLEMGPGKDSAWLAEQIARAIPTPTEVVTDALMVAKVFIKGPWELDGHEMEGEVIEIVNARAETYAEGEGHKPTDVAPTSLGEDVLRREFTFNTLMWRLLDLADGPDKAEIIDLTGCGIRDLEAREMRCPQDPDKTFADDPTRIIRTIKFAFKYGFKLPPDVKAAARRQAKGLKRIPSKVWTVLRDIAFESSQYKKALTVMADLGVVDVLKEMVQEDKGFASTLSNYTRARGIAFLFDLMDLGLPVDASVSFMDSAELARFREITSQMERDEAMEFLEAVRNPGNAIKDKRFMPSLAAKHDIPKKFYRDFFPLVTTRARGILLEHPEWIDDPSRLKAQIEAETERAVKNFRMADGPSAGEVARRASERTAAPEKYSHIDFKPPESVASAAEKGLEYRRKASPSNKGGLTSEEAGQQGIGSGVQRAVNLKNRDEVSPETVKKMHGFFSRHEKNKSISEENKGEPWNDKGYVAWLLWGGDPGQSWAAKVMKQMEAADEKAKKSAGETYGLKGGNEPTNKDLWSKITGQAKKKFKWPSAVASAWAVREYNKQEGGWKKKAAEKALTLDPQEVFEALEEVLKDPGKFGVDDEGLEKLKELQGTLSELDGKSKPEGEKKAAVLGSALGLAVAGVGLLVGGAQAARKLADQAGIDQEKVSKFLQATVGAGYAAAALGAVAVLGTVAPDHPLAKHASDYERLIEESSEDIPKLKKMSKKVDHVVRSMGDKDMDKSLGIITDTLQKLRLMKPPPIVPPEVAERSLQMHHTLQDLQDAIQGREIGTSKAESNAPKGEGYEGYVERKKQRGGEPMPKKQWESRYKTGAEAFGKEDEMTKNAFLLQAWGPDLFGEPLIASEHIPGGLAKGRSPSDFDKDELEMGIEVEKEHLVDDGYSEKELRETAQEISMDHLAELPDYYTRLKKMEQEAEGKKASLLQAWGPTVEAATTQFPKVARSYSRLVMYDFDGTLFRSWESTPDWWEGTSLDDGPYSFFVKPESLDEPCVPDKPGSVYWINRAVSAAKADTRDAGTVTVLITGRVGVHKRRVKELLAQKGLDFDHYYFNPGMSAARFKVVVLKNLLVGYNTVEKVEIWENENQKTYDSAMKATALAVDRDISIEVHHVHENPKELECGPEDFNLPSQNAPQLQERLAFEAGDSKPETLGEWGKRLAGTKTAAVTGDGSKVGLFIPLPEGLAKQFPSLEPHDDSPSHVTFMYIGDVRGREDEFKGALQEALSASLEGPVRAVLDGVDTFEGQEQRVAHSRVRFSEDLIQAHDKVKKHLLESGFEVSHTFPFLTPHVTLAYMPPDQDWVGTPPVGSWMFDSLQVWGLPEVEEVSLGAQVIVKPEEPELGARRFARLTEKRARAARLRNEWSKFSALNEEWDRLKS